MGNKLLSPLHKAVKAIPLWVWPLLASSPYLLSFKIHIFSDMSLYQDLAFKLLHKGEYFDTFTPRGRGPIFVLGLSLFYLLFGASYWATLFYSKLLTVGVILASFRLGGLLFGPGTGLIISLMVSTSPLFCSYLVAPHIDIALLFFLLLFLIFLLQGIMTSKRLYFIFSGIFLGLTTLTKETETPLLLFPFSLFLVKSMRRRDVVYNLLTVLIIAVILMSIWHIIEAHFRKSLILGLTDKVIRISHKHDLKILIYNIHELFANFLKYFLFRIRSHIETPLGLLMGSLYVLYRSYRGSRNHQILTLLLLLHFPSYIFASLTIFKIRQILPLMFFCYLGLSNLIYEGIRSGYQIIKDNKMRILKLNFSEIRLASLVLMISSMIFFTSWGLGLKRAYSNSPIVKAKVMRFYSHNRLSRWMLRHLPRRTNILCFLRPSRISFDTKGAYNFHKLKILWRLRPFISRIKSSPYTRKLILLDVYDAYKGKKPLISRSYKYLNLFEDELYNSIQKNKIKYILVSGKIVKLVLNKYFKRHPKFVLVYKDRINSIFRVKDKYTSITTNIYSSIKPQKVLKIIQPLVKDSKVINKLSQWSYMYKKVGSPDLRSRLHFEGLLPSKFADNVIGLG